MPVTKESILGYKPERHWVNVPEWGGKVYVRVMSATEKDAFELACAERRTDDNKLNLEGIRGLIVAATAEDEAGNRLFSLADAEAVGKLPAPQVDRVFAKAKRINAIFDDDIQALAKNSDSAPNDDSGST